MGNFLDHGLQNTTRECFLELVQQLYKGLDPVSNVHNLVSIATRQIIFLQTFFLYFLITNKRNSQNIILSFLEREGIFFFFDLDGFKRKTLLYFYRRTVREDNRCKMVDLMSICKNDSDSDKTVNKLDEALLFTPIFLNSLQSKNLQETQYWLGKVLNTLQD